MNYIGVVVIERTTTIGSNNTEPLVQLAVSPWSEKRPALQRQLFGLHGPSPQSGTIGQHQSLGKVHC
ncbi:hypothetical protein BpHYR1_010019 [Brachionus plicatilis]|uniref:Uncharacterized protein n=1 Tax=Brachionus plicatilis TaxID=10195 RepID=A0A3M7QF42_BRAPC|nr:hypothetical protein BpHYR1_010019 [Brachionus plicatilis]